MGESGCVSWMFHQKGQFLFENSSVDEEKLMDVALEAGADDIQNDTATGVSTVSCASTGFANLHHAIEDAGLEPVMAELLWIPENIISVEGEVAEKLLALIERLEDQDDVQHVYTNMEISEAEMERIKS